MVAFIVRRFFSSVVVLFCVMALTFLLARLQKGGPFDREKSSSPHVKEILEKKYHLNGTILQQLEAYMGQLVFHGDLGISAHYQSLTVEEVLWQKIPNSFTLGWIAFMIASIGGVALGFLAAMEKDTWVDVSSMLAALLAISIPSFVTGPLLVAVFCLWLGWFPVGGWGGLSHLILPAICLGAPYIAYVARLMRNSLLDVMTQGYMRTAKAKGLPPSQALAKHALKVAILPVVTYLGPMAAYVMTGSFVVEAVFNISGAGSLFVNAIQNKDVFILCGAVFVYCALLLLFNFIVDVLYVFLDKRIQLHA